MQPTPATTEPTRETLTDAVYRALSGSFGDFSGEHAERAVDAVLTALAEAGHEIVTSELHVGQRVTTGRGKNATSPNYAGVITEIIPTYRIAVDSGGWITTEAAGIRALVTDQ